MQGLDGDGTSKRLKQGFTLIELLMVVSIIGVLSALIIGIASLANRKSAVADAQADMQTIANALEEYRVLYGTYPDDLDDVTNATSKVAAEYRVIPATDPWGRPFKYALQSRFAYTLSSDGPSTSITTDDVISGSY